MKAGKRGKESSEGFLSVFTDAWKSRHTPYRFEKKDGYAVINGYRESLLPKAEIPSEICGLPVKKIGARAFLQCNFIEDVSISDGTEVIGDNAFSSCDRLSKIQMADSVTSIGRNVFFECENLYDVTLSSLLREIGARAFFGCTGLRDIALPDSLERIGEGAFSGCVKLKSIRIPLSLCQLPRNVFEGCTALDSIYLERGSYADTVLSQSDYFGRKLRYIPRI